MIHFSLRVYAYCGFVKSELKFNANVEIYLVYKHSSTTRAAVAGTCNSEHFRRKDSSFVCYFESTLAFVSSDGLLIPFAFGCDNQ